ncbi:hypothetical protein [Desulforudis sp. DRI-14]|uniref:hypothetical protein n=1 Tax=Desulforudis sp. DRI-14 TaxID=3459793 RepID=UPI00404135B5
MKQVPLTERQTMLDHLVKHLEHLGYKVTHADHDDYPAPPLIQGYQPAVLAVHEELGLYAIGEIKNKQDLMSKRIQEQIESFSDFSDAKLFLCVPALCRDYLPTFLYDNPNVQVIYYPPFQVESLLVQLAGKGSR